MNSWWLSLLGTTEFSFDGLHHRQEEDYYVLRVGEVRFAGHARPGPCVRRSAGGSPSSAAQTGAEKDQVNQEHNDANDQQIEQALDYEADDAQGYGRDNQQQEQDHRKAFRLAPGQAALAAGAGLIGQAVVLEHAGFVGGCQLAVGVDLQSVLDLFFRVSHAYV